VAFIGNQPFTAAFLTDTFSGTGSQTAFTMTVAPANTSSIIVAVTGVLQDPSTYSVSGTTLTFSAAPPSGTSNISVRYLGIPASGVTTTAYRTVTNFTATAGQTSFSVPSYTVGYIDVYRNGVRLVSTDYTATTGTTVVLNNACTVGDAVVTESFLVSSVLNAIQQYNGSSTNQTLTTPTLTTPTMSTATLTGTSTFAGGVANAYGFGVGTAVPSSGSGISFPATQSASSDANTLDDYEEGTWTPTIFGSAGSAGAQAYATQVGRYIKIGRFVLLTGYIGLSNKGSWTAAVKIGGFPFTVTNESASYSAHAFYYNTVTLPANNFGVGAYVVPNTTQAQLFTSNNTGIADLSDYATQISNSTQMGPWQICYFTSV